MLILHTSSSRAANYHCDSVDSYAGYALNGVRQSTLAYDPATGRLATMLANGKVGPGPVSGDDFCVNVAVFCRLAI